jgi:hypothetical protein
MNVNEGMEVVLKCFQLMDWFPRTPGLYYTPNAAWAREEAFKHLHPGQWDSPIRDHAGQKTRWRGARDYTVVFKPFGKQSMLEGGVGSIRLKPIRMFEEPHWLVTASSDGVTHTGVPLAIPRSLFSPLIAQIHQRGALCTTIRGRLESVPDPFSRLFDRAILVPRLLVKVTDLAPCEPTLVNFETSVAVSFVSDYEGQARTYATYVTFRPDVEGSFEDALSWMKNEYVEGEYRGRIITDFDQNRAIFPEAKLALSHVMDRAISRGELRETIELMHATASPDSYFDEIDRQRLLPERHVDNRRKVFISYAHAPEKETRWVERIRTHLDGLVYSQDLEVWDDTKIDPGETWRNEIARAIGTARVAVLVLTADFLASKFIQEAELPLLLEAAEAEGVTILCVYGSDVHLSGVAERLLQYQFVNDPKKPLQKLSKAGREAVYKKLAASVERAVRA